MREVSDSLHLRRICRIALSERVSDEVDYRKLTRRLGPGVVDRSPARLSLVDTLWDPRLTRRMLAAIASLTANGGGGLRGDDLDPFKLLVSPPVGRRRSG